MNNRTASTQFLSESVSSCIEQYLEVEQKVWLEGDESGVLVVVVLMSVAVNLRLALSHFANCV